MSIIRSALIAATLAAPLALSTAAQAQDKSLYERLGGYDAIAAVVDDFLGRMAADPSLGRFFANMSENSKERARQLTVDFICNAAGGPCLYNGRSMALSHEGMGITEEDWTGAATLLTATLDKFQVPEAEKADVLGFVTGLQGDIVD